jgi:hypothetical protein
MSELLLPDWVDCPNDCGRKARAGHLMCAGCWHEVPKDLQIDVFRTWRRYRNANPRTDRKAYGAAREAYRRARDAALASIR